MNETQALPAPQLAPDQNRQSKWDEEYRAFLRLKPVLMAQHSGKYVAVHDGKVVGEGDDQVEVALQAYDQIGYVPIYVGLVSNEPQPIVRVPSPRIR